MPQDIKQPVVNLRRTIEEHLLERELIDVEQFSNEIVKGITEKNPGQDISEDDNQLGIVASAYESAKPALELVIKARIQHLLFKLVSTDIPQEVTVTRESILQLVGVLSDFEKLYGEAINRKAAEGNPIEEAPIETKVAGESPPESL